MKINSMTQHDNSLTAALELNITPNNKPTAYNHEFKLKHLNLNLSVEVTWPNIANSTYYNSTFRNYFRYTLLVKSAHSNELPVHPYKIYAFSSKSFNITQRKLPTDTHGFYVIVYESDQKPENNILSFDVTFTVGIDSRKSGSTGPFSSLYDDTDLTDFELRAHDGCVKVHKAVLAAESPILKAALSGDWKDTNNGVIDIPDISKKTLVDLKRYLYKRKMPDSGVEPLLLIAACYMMPHLESECIDKLVRTANAENFEERCEFSVGHKMTKLHLALLDLIQSGTVKVKDIRDKSQAPRK